MPTAPGGYRLKDGTRVPSVTTILSRFKESGGLIHWSWSLSYEPLMQARALLERATTGQAAPEDVAAFLALPVDRFDYRAVRDKAADAGTVAHEMVECYVRGLTFDPAKYTPELVEQARPAFEAFREWAGQSRFKIVESEKPIVSEKYRFGGTRDAMLVNGKRSLGDWKTSNAVYVDYLCQLAAYGILDEEDGGVIEGGYHLLRFSKQQKPTDPVQFSHYFYSHLDGARKAFLRMRELYDLMAELKRLAA